MNNPKSDGFNLDLALAYVPISNGMKKRVLAGQFTLLSILFCSDPISFGDYQDTHHFKLLVKIDSYMVLKILLFKMSMTVNL